MKTLGSCPRVRGVLVGRGSERSRIDALIEAARTGQSGVLVLRGEPGIGKTALLQYAAERAEGFAILRAVGVEVESDLPFSALHELLRSVLAGVDALPEQQATAIRTAFALGSPGEVDRFGVYIAVLALLADAAERDPLLLLVDDSQWLDASSAEALRFVARRLAGERVAVIAAWREGEQRSFDAPELPELRLSALHREAAEALLDSRSPGLAQELRDRVLETSAGNPLALIELPAAVGDGSASAEPLAVGRRIEQSFAARARELSDECRLALLVAAAASSSDATTIAPALAELGPDMRAFDEAERASLIEIRDGAILFAHPLVRSAIYHAADPRERRTANRALATAALAAGDRERGAWYLAAATTAPDEDVAAALEDAAALALERTGHAAASAAFERAARLTPDPEQRARRLLSAVKAAWSVGLDTVETLSRQALELTRDDRLRGDIHAELETALYWRGDLQAAHLVKTQTADELESVAPVQSAHMRARSTASLRHFLRGLESVEVARRAHETMVGAGGDDPRVPLMYAQALARVGSVDEALALAEQWGPTTDTAADDSLRMNLAEIWILQDEFDDAVRLLTSWEAPARASGDVSTLTNALEHSARVDVRRGLFIAAYAAASESVELTALLPSEVLQLAESTMRLCEVTAWLGHDAEARGHAARALELAAQCGSTYFEAQVRAAMGTLALSRGGASEAVTELERVRELVRGGGYRHPAFVQFSPELVEAYVRAGRSTDAGAELELLLDEAESVRTPWALAVAARCRGLVDSDLASFEEALRKHAQSPRVVERARTELAYGEALRRSAQRSVAREHLRRALATFESAGAAAWAERARDELRASGEQIRRDDAAREELTPQELQVARTVSAGASNKEAAAQLFLSTKTIEFHLRNAYRKLGVSSRTQLANALRAGPARLGQVHSDLEPLWAACTADADARTFSWTADPGAEPACAAREPQTRSAPAALCLPRDEHNRVRSPSSIWACAGGCGEPERRALAPRPAASPPSGPRPGAAADSARPRGQWTAPMDERRPRQPIERTASGISCGRRASTRRFRLRAWSRRPLGMSPRTPRLGWLVPYTLVAREDLAGDSPVQILALSSPSAWSPSRSRARAGSPVCATWWPYSWRRPLRPSTPSRLADRDEVSLP